MAPPQFDPKAMVDFDSLWPRGLFRDVLPEFGSDLSQTLPGPGSDLSQTLPGPGSDLSQTFSGPGSDLS
ncbi:hypothetical protein K435DRAFT_878575 [Dendrothele bispora CBS 962.96]|uniref:Uncharacterized protein n=1 Tax=Dendrothele bispora (strain CBS 962.96) TaxID=1314807 RepID=A0A4S8KN30_DENBC|nr:hypothetical protein K435DRAFT_878575 [Dendrothele bispora CBS 962.96]